jgi:ribose-phosphate pyrophosphokinase
MAKTRQKRQTKRPIGAKLVAKLLETAGATRIMTMDLRRSNTRFF